MSVLVRCDVCKSKKVIMGLGCFEVDCYNCKGVGFVEEETGQFKQDECVENINNENDLLTDDPISEPMQQRVKRKYNKRKH